MNTANTLGGLRPITKKVLVVTAPNREDPNHNNTNGVLLFGSDHPEALDLVSECSVSPTLLRALKRFLKKAAKLNKDESVHLILTGNGSSSVRVSVHTPATMTECVDKLEEVLKKVLKKANLSFVDA